MFNKKNFLRLLLFSVIICVCASNTVVLTLDPDFEMKKIPFSDFSQKDPVYSIVDFEFIGGILEKTYVRGWAFCETEFNNQDKKISVVLQSISDSKLCYSVTVDASLRADVYTAYKSEKKIYGEKNGIECMCSFVNVKTGKYQVWICVRENDENYGMEKTDFTIEKYKNQVIINRE